MAKTFRPWDVDQQFLLPPSVADFVPQGHVAHFVRDTVREQVDLSAILDDYDEERGFPPFHPAMMTALLLYAYARGVYSSRRIARACEERLDFMAVTAMSKPDFRTIARFRKRHIEALSSLFVEILVLCQKAGLARLGHVALDGTKVHANASKHAAMSYERMGKAEVELAAQVQSWLDAAAVADDADDDEHGPDHRGDEMPVWVADKQRRLAKIREAKAALEAEAKAEEEAREADRKAEAGEKMSSRGKRRGREPKHPRGKPRPKAQRNFTDPDSRIMKTSRGFEQSYNPQAAVDADSQVIVAAELTNCASDQGQLRPLVEQIRANLGSFPQQLSADAGYCSEANLGVLEEHEIRGYVATSRRKHDGTWSEAGAARRGPRVNAMKRRLRRGGLRSRYRLRKQTVEPVFGQLKGARGFRPFLLRGLANVAHEWRLVCAAHNLLKLAAASGRSAVTLA